MASVLIADDHSIVRYGTGLVWKDMFPDGIVYEAENFTETLAIIENHKPDLVILDINIPGGNNLQMIDVLRLRQKDLRILMFSGYDEQMFAIRYLQAGANGYLMKHSPQDELKTAIKAIFKNEVYTSPEIKQYLLNNLAVKKNPDQNPVHLLSDRETEVMQQLIKGMPLATIAKTLNLQVSTVSTYKTRIFEKLGVSNIVDLVEKVRLYSNSI